MVRIASNELRLPVQVARLCFLGQLVVVAVRGIESSLGGVQIALKASATQRQGPAATQAPGKKPTIALKMNFGAA